MSQESSAVVPPDPEQQIRNGANWFYWIAALSMVNSIAAHLEAQWGFIIGLGITQVFDALGAAFQGVGRAVALGFDLVVAGGLVLIGRFARRERTVYIVGMFLFGLDSIIFLVVKDWIGVGFHAFVLVSLWAGYRGFEKRALAHGALPPTPEGLAPTMVPPVPPMPPQPANQPIEP